MKSRNPPPWLRATLPRSRIIAPPGVFEATTALLPGWAKPGLRLMPLANRCELIPEAALMARSVPLPMLRVEPVGMMKADGAAGAAKSSSMVPSRRYVPPVYRLLALSVIRPEPFLPSAPPPAMTPLTRAVPAPPM